MRQKDLLLYKIHKNKRNFEHEVCSGEVSPCCLRSGCPDADLKLRSWASAWFPLRFLVLSPQEFLPLTDQLETWPRASVPLSCPEPSRSSLYLLFWHPSSMEKRNGPSICERRGKNDVPSIVLMSVLSNQGFLTGRVPRECPEVCHLLVITEMMWDDINHPLCFQKALFSPQQFQLFPSFHSHNSLEEKEGTSGFIVKVWSSDQAVLLTSSVWLW